MPLNPVGQLMRSAMDRKGMTVTDVAREIDRSRSWVYAIMEPREDDKKLTATYTIDEIAEVLDIDHDELYAAAGTIPPDIKRDLVTSKHTIKAARKAIARAKVKV